MYILRYSSKAVTWVAYHNLYHIHLPEPHRFPMEKYSLLREQLEREGICDKDDFFSPDLPDNQVILNIHDRDYYARFCNLEISKSEMRATGFVHNKQVVERERRIIEGTRRSAELAIKGGVAMNIAGGTHHAYSNRGEGFCMLNDQAAAAAWLIQENLANRVLIIDLDVHQGNGTAEIFRNNRSVFTFSMHGQNNYPLHKEQSDLDVALNDGIEDDEYLKLLQDNLKKIKNLFQPDFLFYQCGVDVLKTDKLGRLGLTKSGCQERDAIVFNYAATEGLPVVCCMGGGYSEDIRIIIDAHTNTFKQAVKILR